MFTGRGGGEEKKSTGRWDRWSTRSVRVSRTVRRGGGLLVLSRFGILDIVVRCGVHGSSEKRRPTGNNVAMETVSLARRNRRKLIVV